MPCRHTNVIRPADPPEDAALDVALAAFLVASNPLAARAPAANGPARPRRTPRLAPSVRTPSRPRKKDIQP